MSCDYSSTRARETLARVEEIGRKLDRVLLLLEALAGEALRRQEMDRRATSGYRGSPENRE